jgi:hypothetical protein
MQETFGDTGQSTAINDSLVEQYQSVPLSQKTKKTFSNGKK